jgi:hypothetical protein
MPIISALSLYGLVLRLNQYGWSVERCWAFVVWLILTLLAVGYVIGIVRRRAEWTIDLARVNRYMGLVVLGLMILTNSPILDFRKISLNSQMNRVDAGQIGLEGFDFWYAKQHLARPGYLAMEEMKREVGDSDPDLLGLINNPVNRWGAQRMRAAEEMWAEMTYRPESFDVPDELKGFIGRQYYGTTEGDPVMIQVDLDADGQNEYLLFLLRNYGIAYSQFYYLTDEGWRDGNLSHAGSNSSGDEVREMLKNGDISIVDPRFKDLKIGDVLLQPSSKNDQ